MLTKFYQHNLALVFAVNEINENPRLLPNVTLGFRIYDSYYDAQMTYRTVLDLLFKSHRFLPNYKCATQNNLMAVIGGLGSVVSFHMRDILGLYKIPQVGAEHGCMGICKYVIHSTLVMLGLILWFRNQKKLDR